ncbi:MAG: hypothetical protein EBU30_00235 [Synechococcaceae bacterium WB6_3B_236]|jgi:hypothetical protein|nr:hypothetical protein [Synechococcaceae bacterium WB6_3B_236]
MENLLVATYLICFAAITGGAFALMAQTLRRPENLKAVSPGGPLPRRHPEAPSHGEEVLYVDLNRERLEALFKQAS